MDNKVTKRIRSKGKGLEVKEMLKELIIAYLYCGEREELDKAK